MTRVLVIEDHPLVAEGLRLGLEAEGFEVRCTDGDPAALPSLLAAFPVDVVLLDIYLANGRSGIDLIAALREPGRSVLVLTGETDPEVLARALGAGADAVLDKTTPFPRLIREITTIPTGRSVEAANRRAEVLHAARLIDEQRAHRLAPFAVLTHREEQVLAMLIDGVQAADIAARSFVSLSTIRSQIRSILTKLGVGSQLTAVSMAIKAGWAPGWHRSHGPS